MLHSQSRISAEAINAEHKINPRVHSPQQNKTAVLTTDAYFKVSTPLHLQRQPRLSLFAKEGETEKCTPPLNSA